MKTEGRVVHLGGRSHVVRIRPKTADEAAIRQVVTEKQYDLTRWVPQWKALEAYAKRRAPERPLIVDAGAHIGMASVWFGIQHAALRPLIVALEPEDENFQLLRENTRGLNVVHAYNALASTRGWASIHNPGNGSMSFRAERSEVGTLPTWDVGSIYAEAPPDVFPWIVKIDIEGAEKEVFSQNTEWIAATPLIVIELHDWMLPGQGSALPFLRAVAAHDRDFLYAGECVFSFANGLGAWVVPL